MMTCSELYPFDFDIVDRPSWWDPAAATQPMSKYKGHFDNHVFQAFLKWVGIYPVGPIAQLKMRC